MPGRISDLTELAAPAADDQVEVLDVSDLSMGASGTNKRSPISALFKSPYVNVKDYGAVGNGTTNDSSAFQAAINAADASGGAVQIPAGVFRVANLRLREGVSIVGVGSDYYGFTHQGGGSVLRAPDTLTTNCVVAVAITAPGTGYSSAPTVAFSGGGGSGATATAAVAGGAVTGVRITDPGTGYTSTPTVTLSGGGGSGAAVTAVVAGTIFYTTGAHLLAGGSLRHLQLDADRAQNWAGVIVHDSNHFHVDDVDFYDFALQALWFVRGPSPKVTNCEIFGLSRPNAVFSAYMGALQLGGTDGFVSNCEVGAAQSGVQAKLWNAAIQLDQDGGGNALVNIIAEGSDVGVRIYGPYNALTNVRADINYGHGFYLTRDNAGGQPPSGNRLVNCWSHRNSKYGNNLFDNFRIEEGKDIARTTTVGCASTYDPGDGYAHRYGLFDGSFSDGVVTGFSDRGAVTGWMRATLGTSGLGHVPPNLLYVGGNLSTLNVARQGIIRVDNATPTTITVMTGGVHGQVIYVQSINTNTSIGGGYFGNDAIQVGGPGGEVLAMVPYVAYPFIRLYQTWYLVGKP